MVSRLNGSDSVESEMMYAEKCQLPGMLTLDCRINVLNIHGTRQSIGLSESQKRLMQCLMNDISCKRRIIKFVWHECHERIRDNNYHQLVYQFRNTLLRHQLPADLLVTIPHHGLVLNREILSPPKGFSAFLNMARSQKIIHSGLSSLSGFVQRFLWKNKEKNILSSGQMCHSTRREGCIHPEKSNRTE